MRKVFWGIWVAWLFWACGGGAGIPPQSNEWNGEENFGQVSLFPQQGNSWAVETVDSAGNIGWQTSIGSDDVGNVKISYYEQVLKDLRLATGAQGGPWNLQTLDAPFDNGKYNSLFWDGVSDPFISFYQSGGKLKVYSAGVNVADPNADLGAYNDITLAGSVPHISYTGTYVITNINKRSQLRHAYFDGSTWLFEIIEDAPANSGSFAFTSIAYDGESDTFHISYKGRQGELRHAWGNTGSWQTEAVLPGNPNTQGVGQTSILVAQDGSVHIFYNKTSAGLFHAWTVENGWNVEKIASGYGIMTPSAAVQDSGGNFHISAYQSSTKDLAHIFSVPASWQMETVDSSGDTGKFASIFVDSQSCLHIAYVNDSSDDLKYATKCLMPQIESIFADPDNTNEGGEVQVTVTATEPENQPLSYTWEQISPASPMGWFENPNASSTIWRAPPIPSGPVNFVLRATVCDITHLCDSATVTISVINIFDGPAYGATSQAGTVSCQGGGNFGPSLFLWEETERIIPLLIPDETRYLMEKENPSGPFVEPVGKITTKGFTPQVAPALEKDFHGIAYTGLRPPDPHIAAGPNHLIALVNSHIGIFDKQGNLLLQKSAFSWFSPVNDLSFIFDPKVNYDGYNQRWLILFHATNFQAGLSRWLLAASQTSDPMGCWWLWILDNTLNGSIPSSPPNWADYTDMGFDGNYIYLSSNQFSFPPYNFAYVKVRVLKASEVYSGAQLNWVDYWNLKQANGDLAFTVRPSYNVGATLPPMEYLANAHWPGDTLITLWGIKEPFSATPGFLRKGIPVNPYSIPPDAKQPGTSCRVDTIDSRIMNVIWKDGSLWTVQNTAVNWGSGTVSGLKYHHIRTDTLTLEEDIYFGEDGIDYYDGAVMEDNSGIMATVFARSSPSIYAGAYYTVKRPGEGIDPVIGILKEGANIVTDGCGGRGARWGDYAGNWIDPSDLNTFWIFHEYVPASPGNTWDTWIGALNP
ncbi:MAG: hypothetical protein V2G48_02320 [bacterium JZ-2024 1]